MTGKKWIAIGVISCLLIGGLAYFIYEKAQNLLADEQIDIFKQMETKALVSTAREAVEKMEYVIFYYPSGTKQTTGSALDLKVESERVRAISSIITYLQKETQKDLGDDPQKWINEYAKNYSNRSPSPEAEQDSKQYYVIFSDKDNGKTIKIPMHQKFKISLYSIPSTGFSWHLEGADSQHLLILKDTFKLDPNPEETTGVGGYKNIDFQCIKVGKSEIKLKFKSGEDGKYNIFAIAVDIIPEAEQ